MGAASGMNGEYIILNVAPGRYNLVATYMGYQKMTVQEIIVTVGLSTFQEFAMQKIVLEGQEVVIVAERPLVDKNATNDVKIIRSEDIENIPVRGYQNVVGAQAGAVQSGGNIYVRGGRPDEVAYYVDGVLMNNPYSQSRTGNVSDAALEEINYQPGGMSAEYGGFNSGVVSTSTRTGGSKISLHGEVVNDEIWSKTGDEPGLYSYGFNLYNISVGGPVPMTDDKLRFFTNVEYTYTKDNAASWGPTVVPSVFVADVDELLALDPQPVFRYGQKGANPTKRITGTANLYYSTENFKFKLGGSADLVDWRPYSHANYPFNAGNGLYDDSRDTFTGYFKTTWLIGPTAFLEANVNYYSTYFEQLNSKWGNDYNATTDTSRNMNNSNWGLTAPTQDEFSRFATFDSQRPTFYKEKNTRMAFKLDGTWQVNQAHELKAGVEAQLSTVRFYQVDLNRLGGQFHGSNPPETQEEIELAYRTAYLDNAGYNTTGVSEINSGRDDARRPMILSGYILDKIEFKDLVMSLSLRVDYFDIGQRQLIDPENIIITDGLIDDATLKDPATYLEISPRLGFAFPVTDKTVFHLQYGKYVQPAPYQNTYVTWSNFAADLTQGNATQSSNPSLEPVKTTSYEVGFEQQIGMNASLDITAFYKEVLDQISVRNLESNINTYAAYVNGDFGNTKGFSFDFTLRRTNRVSANMNYTMQWANGTGSDPRTAYRIAWIGGDYATYVSPLDFDQRHTAMVNVDFRTLAEDGPAIGDFYPLGSLGFNFFFQYGSGLAYTPETPRSVFFSAAHTRLPTGGINSAHAPATSQLNIRIDKRIKVGRLVLNPYVWIINALNTKNQTFVYNATGVADDDGYLSTPEGVVWSTGNPSGAKWYKARLNDPGNYGDPIQIRLGLRLDFK
jgi:hypothetical protein